jgi:hypothetical protein
VFQRDVGEKARKAGGMNSLRVFRIDGSVYFIPITFSSQEEFDSEWTRVGYHTVPLWARWRESDYAVRVLDSHGRIIITVSITMEGFNYLHAKYALCMESEDNQSPPENPPRDEAAEFRSMVEMHKHWLRAQGDSKYR